MQNKPEDKTTYIFKSLLRQNYFNERFKAKSLPASILKKECQREYKNLTIGSENLTEMENIQYCEEITASYLTKYFPY